MWRGAGLTPVPIQTVTRPAARVWYVESWWEPLDLHPSCVVMRNWLDEHFVRKERRGFDGITVYRYDRPSTGRNP